MKFLGKIGGLPFWEDETMEPDAFRLIPPGHFEQRLPRGVPPTTVIMTSRVGEDNTTIYKGIIQVNGDVRWVRD